jgi:hypothetical protein
MYLHTIIKRRSTVSSLIIIFNDGYSDIWEKAICSKSKNAAYILIFNIKAAFEAVEGGFEPPRGS